MRFHLEIMAAVVNGVAGQGLAGMRMSQSRSSDFNHKWSGGMDDARAIFVALASAGADFLHVSTHQGLGEEFDSGHTLAGLARKFAKIPVIACGKLEVPENAERILATGEADLIAMARGALGDPSWPHKLASGVGTVAFDPEMISPFATLDATIAWRAANGVTFEV